MHRAHADLLLRRLTTNYYRMAQQVCVFHQLILVMKNIIRNNREKEESLKNNFNAKTLNTCAALLHWKSHNVKKAVENQPRLLTHFDSSLT